MRSLSEHSSCWGVARWAVVGFLVAVALVYLFGGFPSVPVAAG